MPKAKQHNWKKHSSIKNFYTCTNCGINKTVTGDKIMLHRGDITDNSATKNNCFKLSRDSTLHPLKKIDYYVNKIYLQNVKYCQKY